MKVHRIIALDIVGVALLAAGITFFGCNSEQAISEERPSAQTNQQDDAMARAEIVVAPSAPPVPVEPQAVRTVTYEEAETAYNEKRYEDAADLFASYTELKPNNPWGHYMLGLSAWQVGVHETAERAFTRALQLDPHHVKSMLNRSRVLLDTGRPEDALEQLYDVFEIDPESGIAYRLQGRAMHQLGDTADAIAAYQDAIRIDETDAWAINNLALIYIEQDRFEEALPAMARATELRDDIAIFRNNLGMALENTGRYRAAEAEYQAAVDRNAKYEAAAANLARVSAVDEDPSAEPVDLALLAESFVADCERRPAAAALDPVEAEIAEIESEEESRFTVTDTVTGD